MSELIAALSAAQSKRRAPLLIALAGASALVLFALYGNWPAPTAEAAVAPLAAKTQPGNQASAESLTAAQLAPSATPSSLPPSPALAVGARATPTGSLDDDAARNSIAAQRNAALISKAAANTAAQGKPAAQAAASPPGADDVAKQPGGQPQRALDLEAPIADKSAEKRQRRLGLDE